MKQVLLYTDTISFYFRNNQSVVDHFNHYLETFGFIHLSVVTYYEIMNGLYYKDARKQLKAFERFVAMNNVINLTKNSARKAAYLYSNLRQNGVSIGHTDIMIAAIAMDYDLQLITNNEKHFNKIEGLDWDNWTKNIS